jgi:SAM-dependent methyltransferase
VSEHDRKGRLCAIQMHHTDVVAGREKALARRNAAGPLLDSGLFERVVLAAADVPENDVLEPWAERFGVELFKGEVEDVGARLAAAARAAECSTVARALAWWFFVDVKLVRAQLDLLAQSGAEYVNLPPDFDLRFGADVSTVDFLERASRLAPAAFRRNPWGFAEAHPARFKIETFEDVPTYSRARFERVRAGMRELWPSQHDGAATPLQPYRIALEHLPAGGRALDLACGLGAGSALLAERGSVLGVDVDAQALARARERYGARVEFIACDAFELQIEDASLDLAVSVHTLEHVEDDAGFLELLARWLKRDGTLVLEAPLLARRPFLGIAEPLSPDHVREYDVRGLVGLVAERFRVREAYGVNRGAYLDLENARSAVLVVAEPR